MGHGILRVKTLGVIVVVSLHGSFLCGLPAAHLISRFPILHVLIILVVLAVFLVWLYHHQGGQRRHKMVLGKEILLLFIMAGPGNVGIVMLSKVINNYS